MPRVFIFSAFLLVLLITSCTSDPTRPSNDGGDTSPVSCTEPRPEICTQIYDPVCGDNDETYSNSCTACSDPAVVYSVKGECV